MAKIPLRQMIIAIEIAAAQQGYTVVVSHGNSQRVTLEVIDSDVYEPTTPPDLGVAVKETITAKDRFGR